MATVTGRLVSATGAPKTASEVSLARLTSDSFSQFRDQTATTDGYGNFSFSNLPAGLYQISCDDDIVKFRVTEESGSFLISNLLA